MHFARTAKSGKIYLTKSMRVVFANRVPDGKERLRVVLELPDKNHLYRPFHSEPGKKKPTVSNENNGVTENKTNP